MAANPSIILRAFAPDTDYVLTLDGALLLEQLGCKYMTGGNPGLRDIILSILVMTDEAAVLDALKKRRFEKLFSEATKGKRPGEILALGDKVAAALEAAVAPSPPATNTEAEKKSTAEQAGGSN